MRLKKSRLFSHNQYPTDDGPYIELGNNPFSKRSSDLWTTGQWRRRGEGKKEGISMLLDIYIAFGIEEERRSSARSG